MDKHTKQVLNIWRQYAKDNNFPNIDTLMVLDPQAGRYMEKEIQATMDLLPSGYIGGQGVELGCGAGRLTVHFANKVDTLLACELVPEFAIIAQKRCLGMGIKNVNVINVNASEMELPDNSCNLVILKWILMYLNDRDSINLIHRVINAIKPGGWLLFQETINVKNKLSKHFYYKTQSNAYPVRYRHEKWYLNLLNSKTKYWHSFVRYDLTSTFGTPSNYNSFQQIAYVGRKMN